MNWTGGRLQRHSGSKGNAAARQKQHFAKVQQGLRGNTRKRSPIRLSIFDHVVEDRRQVRRGSSAVESLHRDRSHSIQYGRPQLIPNLLSRHEKDDVTQFDQRVHNRPTPVKRRASPVPDDDLYNATPPPRPPRIKRDPSVALPQLEHLEEMDESLSEKRRRLLRKGDWVGIGIQKPVGIKFAASMIDENVGRRKRLTGATGARYQSRQSHITSPFAIKRRRQYSPTMESSRRGHQKSDVKISIRGKVVNPGVSSSSMGGRGASRKLDERRRSLTEISDLMLLDEGSGATPHGSQEHRRLVNETSLRNIERAPTPFMNRNPEALESSEQETSSSVQRNNIKNQPLQSNNKQTQRSSSKPRDSRKHLISRGTPKKNHKVSSVCEEEATYIVSSEPSSIHQPVPRNSRKSKILRPEFPEKYGSTVAQVGERALVVPKSQQLQNDIWASWVALESDDKQTGEEDDDHDDDHGTTRRASISPGISTIFATRQRTQSNSISVQSSALESPAINEDEEDEYDQNEEEELVNHESKHENENEDTENPENEYEDDEYEGNGYDEDMSAHLGSPKAPSEEIQDSQKDVREGIAEIPKTFSPFRKFQTITVADDHNIRPEEKREFTDELWRKFVFGDGDDSSDEAEVVDPAPPDLRKNDQVSEYTDLSIAGQPATEIHPSPWLQDNDSDSQAPTTRLSRSSSFSGYVGQIQVFASSVSLKTKQRQEERKRLQDQGIISSSETNTQPNAESSTMAGTAEPVSPLVSMVAHAPSSSLSRVSGTRATTSSGQKKVLFTKPKSFNGEKAEKPQKMNIGRPSSLKDRLAEFELKKEKRRGRDIYDIYDTDEEEVESIEDE